MNGAVRQTALRVIFFLRSSCHGPPCGAADLVAALARAKTIGVQ